MPASRPDRDMFRRGATKCKKRLQASPPGRDKLRRGATKRQRGENWSGEHETC